MAKILAVDDARSMCEIIKAILTKEGHEVTTVLSGREALELAKTQTFDIVLTDVNMPEMNGISLVSKLRLKEGFEYVPIIMVTTEGKDYKKSKARTMGASGWLQKPFTPERLKKAVDRFID